MNRPFLLSFFICLSVGLAGCELFKPPVAESATQVGLDVRNYPKVAVCVAGGPYGFGNEAETIIQGGLLRNGFEVAERSEVERVLREINFQGESGMTKEQQAKFGDAIGCRGLVVVSLNGWGKVSAKMLDLKKCTTVWTASGCSAKVVAEALPSLTKSSSTSSSHE